jgi:DNA-binding XRE family transcriptional regulator
MITAAQLRAARGLLDWTRGELADAAKISPETVKNIEHGTFRPQEQTAEAIVKAFAVYDVIFTEDDGVKIQKNQVRTFIGSEGYAEYLDHIYTIVKSGGKIRQFNLSDGKNLPYAGDYAAQHLQRMEKIQNLDARVLTFEGDYNFPASYCSYRWLSKEHSILIPYYVYGDNISMPSVKNDSTIEIVSIHSKMLSDNYSNQFESFWGSAIIPASKKGSK